MAPNSATTVEHQDSQLARWNHQRQLRKAAAKPLISRELRGEYYRGRLKSLFDQEWVFSRIALVMLLNSIGNISETRETVVKDCGDGFVEEKWRFQRNILRVECNFLRIEREFVLKKLEMNRV